MEVGAVKQAFNNEVIHLKKPLNQAKIQTIHKLTRKAKTFNEKKAPDHIKDKLKRKAESAVNEVLIIKKLKPRIIARFIITHSGSLNDHLNKPTVDQDKACARLLLHKSLQDKYKLIKEKFGNISINDLLMSRQERRKLKKEMLDKQKNKKKDKEQRNKDRNTRNMDDQNDVEIDTTEFNHDDKEPRQKNKIIDIHIKNLLLDSDIADAKSDDKKTIDVTNDNVKLKQKNKNKGNREKRNETFKSSSDIQSEIDNDAVISDSCQSGNKDSSDEEEKNSEASTSDRDESEEEIDNELGKFVKLKHEHITKITPVHENTKKKPEKRKANKKNKNIKEKIRKINFHKDLDEPIPAVAKVVDPFFITSTGDNYLSVAEPRPPDEVKEVHKQGNRKYRRAVMFGHVPKNSTKPRRDNFKTNSRFNSADQDQISSTKKFRKDENGLHRHKNDNFAQNKLKNLESEEKLEKLHPSWEAKKKQSSILPFLGKKIVFDNS
ncbi:unnamed protein product [Leptidea sinapis]|uniref:Serum response factor-binding protein 1 n=1 Tax=Leptidea sinapis TaxID=189913 RepID=A0A5E4QM55_9NEOP|nr:unnamed protein product [Leptidea sinapis]